MTEESETICMACSILRQEIEHLRDMGEITLPLRFLQSSLHLKPEELRQQLASEVDKESRNGNKVVLVYGDCHSHMVDLDRRPNVARTRGANCYEIMLGREVYRNLRRGGVFFLMPEWAVRWQEIFCSCLEMTEANTREMMQSMHSKIIYIDTELVKMPEEHVRNFSSYCGLGWERMQVPLDHLLQSIRAAVEQLE